MADDEGEDLYDEEFDFVDEDDEEDEQSEVDEAEVASDTKKDAKSASEDGEPSSEGGDDVDEYGRPEPTANYVVHIYEHQKLKRTIDRPFTPENAEAFTTEYNRTAKSYGRVAVAGKNDAKPKKSIDAPPPPPPV